MKPKLEYGLSPVENGDNDKVKLLYDRGEAEPIQLGAELKAKGMSGKEYKKLTQAIKKKKETI